MSIVDPSQPVLVYLAQGVQGAAVVRAALQRGLRVRALVRDRRRAHALQALGVELAEGDLDDRESLQAASRGVAHAVIQMPTGTASAMCVQAANALAASLAEGVRSCVLKLASASRHAACAEPGFVANAMVESLVRQSGLPFAIVRPTLYLDNLLKPSARRDIVERGVFEPPIAASQRIAWTSVDDGAEAALALLQTGVDGTDHRIAGPESLTGEDLAARIAAGLGRPVSYRAQSLDAFEQEVDAAMGPGMGRRIASKFRYFAAHPEEAEVILATPFQRQPGLEGFQPTDVATWAARHRDNFLFPL